MFPMKLCFLLSLLERIHISTPNKYEYQYVKKPSKMKQFEVAVKTHNDAHIALSASPHDSVDLLEIVLGGRQNTRSWISLGKMGDPLVSVSTPGMLSWDEFRSFWISWRGGVVQVGIVYVLYCKTLWTHENIYKIAQIKAFCFMAKRWLEKTNSTGLSFRLKDITSSGVPPCKILLRG